MTLNTFTKPWSRTGNAFRRSLTLCFPCSPSRGGEDSECVQSPPEGGKTSCVQSPPEREKTLGVQSQDISNLVQFKSVYIQEKAKDLPVGGRLRQFLPE